MTSWKRIFSPVALMSAAILVTYPAIGVSEQIKWPVEFSLDSGMYTIHKAEVAGMKGKELTYRSPVELVSTKSSAPVPGELMSFWDIEFENDGKTPKMAYITAIEVHFPDGYQQEAVALMETVRENLPVTTLDLREDIETAEESSSGNNPGSKKSGYNTEPTTYKYDYDREESVKQAEENNQLRGKGGLLVTPGGKTRGFWN